MSVQPVDDHVVKQHLYQVDYAPCIFIEAYDVEIALPSPDPSDAGP